MMSSFTKAALLLLAVSSQGMFSSSSSSLIEAGCLYPRNSHQKYHSACHQPFLATTAEPILTRVSTFTNTDMQSSRDGTKKSLNDYNPKCKNDSKCKSMMRYASPLDANSDPIYSSEDLGICEKCSYAASTTHPFDECEDAPECMMAGCSDDACHDFRR